MSQRFVRQPIGPQLLKELRGEEPSTGMELDQELALESSKVGKQMLICKMGFANYSLQLRRVTPSGTRQGQSGMEQ
jgi:hypothetical protein